MKAELHLLGPASDTLPALDCRRTARIAQCCEAEDCGEMDSLYGKVANGMIAF